MSTTFGSNIKLKKYNAANFSETTGIEIQIQHWSGNRQLSLEGISVGYYPNYVDPRSKGKNLYYFHE